MVVKQPNSFIIFYLFEIVYIWQIMFILLTEADVIQLKLKCQDDDFPCMDGTQCVSKSFLCDERPDCLDNSDELICAAGPKTCTHPEEFQCYDGECIPRYWVRDTGPDCQDGSDEIDVMTYCQRGTDRFLCDNKEQCIPASYLCDSVQQCLDGSDEKSCDIPCLNHNCSHTCRLSPAGAICSCPLGYVLMNDTTCVDQDECVGARALCEQLCVNTNGSFHCACKDGYQLWTDQRSCVKTSNQTDLLKEETVKLIVAGIQGIFGVTVQYLDVSKMSDHMTSSHMTGKSQLLLQRDVDALAYEPIKSLLVFHDVMESAIKSLSLQERGADPQVTDLYSDVVQLEALAIDPLAKNLYWTTYLGFLFVGKLDGSMTLKLLKKGLDKPRGIALDIEESFLYLTVWGHSSHILRCLLDGTGCITILYLTGHPNFIVIEPVYLSDDLNRSLYWTDSKEDLICSITTGQSSVKQIQLNNTRNPHPFGLAVTRSAIFYTDLNTHRLHSFMKSDNTTIFDLELDLGSLYSILVIDKNQDLSTKNGCHDNNGGCSHFCFSKPGGQHKCKCPLNQHLGLDNKTCNGEDISILTPENSDVKIVHNHEEWQNGHISNGIKPGDRESTETGGSKVWIVGVVLGIVFFVLALVLLVLLYIKKNRGEKFELPKVLRYHKVKQTEEFQELVSNEALSKMDSQQELQYVNCMTGYRQREISMISVDSAFTEPRTDSSSDASLGSLTAA